MDRTWIVALSFGFVSCTQSLVAQTGTPDSELPFRVVAMQCTPIAVKEAVDYCKFLGFNSVDGILAEFAEDDDAVGSMEIR